MREAISIKTNRPLKSYQLSRIKDYGLCYERGNIIGFPEDVEKAGIYLSFLNPVYNKMKLGYYSHV